MKKIYYQFELSSEADTYLVPIVSSGGVDDALALIVNEHHDVRAGTYSVANEPRLQLDLPEWLSVVPIDTKMKTSCWSTIRVDDFVFGYGDGRSDGTGRSANMLRPLYVRELPSSGLVPYALGRFPKIEVMIALTSLIFQGLVLVARDEGGKALYRARAPAMTP